MKKLFLPVILLLSGCATIMTGTNQKVEVTALNQKNEAVLNHASCSIVDSTGAVYPLDTNPGEATVPKGKGPLQVKCTQLGYKDYAGAINSHFNGISVLNVIFWPGFFVDMATGAIQQYPSRYTAVMKPVDA